MEGYSNIAQTINWDVEDKKDITKLNSFLKTKKGVIQLNDLKTANPSFTDDYIRKLIYAQRTFDAVKSMFFGK
jgi:hypothetical protein